MFKLVQTECFAGITATIAEAAVRLPLHSRAQYIKVALDQEIHSARALLQRALLAKKDKAFSILDLLEQLGVRNAWKPAAMIVARAERLRAPQLERLLLKCSYATAHEAIQAVAQIETVQIAIKRYVDAEVDARDAGELYLKLRAMRISLDTCMRDRGRELTGLTSVIVKAASDLAVQLPVLARCAMNGTFEHL